MQENAASGPNDTAPPSDVGRRLFALYRRALRRQAYAELHRQPTASARQERILLWRELARLGATARDARL
jgi:hypothetical protein